MVREGSSRPIAHVRVVDDPKEEDEAYIADEGEVTQSQTLFGGVVPDPANAQDPREEK